MNSTSIARWGSTDTRFGTFSMAIDATGALVATAFGGLPELRTRAPHLEFREDQTAIAPLQRQIAAYLADPRSPFRTKIAPRGSQFQRRVWSALCAIPVGETRSYGQLAAELGSSPRAVGRANATNPLCLVVPCHRVIGSDGSLTGFAFGEAVKRGLLAHEGVRLQDEARPARSPALAASAGP